MRVMKANYTFARHASSAPCSAAWHAAVSPDFIRQTLENRLHSAENADKTQTKCRQKRECDFFNPMIRTTYNFKALKCLNFRNVRNLNPNLTLPRLHSSFLRVSSLVIRHYPRELLWSLDFGVSLSPPIPYSSRRQDVNPNHERLCPLKSNHLITRSFTSAVTP